MRNATLSCVSVLTLCCAGCPGVFPPSGGNGTLGSVDSQLQELLGTHGVQAITKPETDGAKVALGRALFFDKLLSGNRNISCSTCHTPLAFTGDGLSLAIGEGGSGLSVSRSAPLDADGAPIHIPRNSPEVFNRAGLSTMFWDARVTDNGDGSFVSPAGDALLPGLDSALAVQAMFPVTSDAEMRGMPGDNELGDLDGNDLPGIWSALMDRILAFDEYRDMFAAAFPGESETELTFAHAANAIAAFEIEHWTLTDSPFDDYLRGSDDALSTAAKNGALLFFGRAGCGECHTGSLLTDEDFHNRGVPQLGPGKGDGDDGLSDFGRERVTGEERDRYAFRTPPLRNVAATGPWMHSGSFTSLEAVVRHELDPVSSAMAYDAGALRPDFAASHHPQQTAAILSRLDQSETAAIDLSDSEVADLVSFLESLTSPSLGTLAQNDTPARVPSGLPLAD